LIDNLVDNAEQHGLEPLCAVLAAGTITDTDGARPAWTLVLENALSARSRSDGVAPHRGFGLVLSRHIAMAHGGTLESTQTADRYRVVLSLPVR